MAVWLHTRGARAAISRRRNPGKFLRCRLDASLSRMGAPDLNELRSYIFCAAHAGPETSLGNKQAVGLAGPAPFPPLFLSRIPEACRCVAAAVPRLRGYGSRRGGGSRVIVPSPGQASGQRNARKARLTSGQTQGLRSTDPGLGDPPQRVCTGRIPWPRARRRPGRLPNAAPRYKAL